MLEVKGDIWKLYESGAAICITTNGTVNVRGEIVMGRGTALDAKKRIPKLPLELAKRLSIIKNGKIYRKNLLMWFKEYNLFTFPVKHNWWEKADIDLIRKSAIELDGMMDLLGLEQVVLPRPGCGNGQLDWEKDVKPILKDILDNRVLVITNEP